MGFREQARSNRMGLCVIKCLCNQVTEQNTAAPENNSLGKTGVCKKHTGITFWTLLQDRSCMLGLPRELPAVTIPSPYNFINLLFTLRPEGALGGPNLMSPG